MKVLHTIFGMSTANGGPTTCTYTLVKTLRKENIDTEVLTFSPPLGEILISNESFLKTVDRPKENRFGYSKKFSRELKKNIPDVIHINGLWHYSSFSSSKFANKKNIPVIFSPHGMLYPQALNRSSLFKQIALQVFQKKQLDNASVIHATSEQEKDHVRGLGFKNAIAVIPNPIELLINLQSSKPNAIKRVGFMGRLDPIKNIEDLLQAWGETGAKHKDCELVIVGSGEVEYVKSLKNLAGALNIQNIKFTGFLEGQEKDRILSSFSFLVLPSKSENFGMVVAEALLQRVPVIASKGTPWQELSSCKAGWWIDEGELPLAKALNEALLLKEPERIKMGNNGRDLIVMNYSAEKVSNMMIKLYNWVLGREDKPAFVSLYRNE